MTQRALEERVAALERQMAELKTTLPQQPSPKDWRLAIGMCSGDELMKQIDAAGQAIREAERQRARRQRKRKSKAQRVKA